MKEAGSFSFVPLKTFLSFIYMRYKGMPGDRIKNGAVATSKTWYRVSEKVKKKGTAFFFISLFSFYLSVMDV